tara:strand:- start:751 stop:924 length:174 start_codon:yes stop_codon:yes gene_type:complete
MTDEKPALAQTPTQMAFKIQDLEIKLNNIEQQLTKITRITERLERESNVKKTKTNNK